MHKATATIHQFCNARSTGCTPMDQLINKGKGPRFTRARRFIVIPAVAAAEWGRDNEAATGALAPASIDAKA